MIRLTRAQVREVDRIAIQEYGIPGIVLMENAARGVADQAILMLSKTRGRRAVIACGGGNNGGDGLAVARLLNNLGIDVCVLRRWNADFSGDARTNFCIIQKMNLKIVDHVDFAAFDLVIDAIFGTGLTRPIEGEAARTIAQMNAAEAPILAVDLPSGLDCDTGKPLGNCVRATTTVTFVAEKAGFANPDARQYTGTVYVRDIGAPPEIVERALKETH